jgi:hypothetical protein
MTEPVASGAAKEGGGDGGDQTTTQAQGDSTQQSAAAEKPWYSAYPEDLHDSLKGYDKPETLAKEHLTLKQKYAVPEKPEEYEFDAKDLDEIQKKSLEEFRKEAKDYGLTKEQFKRLVARGLEQNKQFWERRKAEESEAKTKKDAESRQGIEELQKEWGNKFKENVDKAKKTMQNIFPASFGKFLDDSGLGNAPEMVRAMVRLSESISEDVLVKSQSKNKASNRDPMTGEPMLNFTSMK